MTTWDDASFEAHDTLAPGDEDQAFELWLADECPGATPAQHRDTYPCAGWWDDLLWNPRDEDQADEGPTCSICDGLGHGYPGAGPCPLEERPDMFEWEERCDREDR